MKYCPRCGNLIEGTINCTECGFKTKKKEKEEINIKNWSTDIMKVDNSNYKEEYKIETNFRFDTWKI